MDSIVYKHNRKIINISIAASSILFFISLYRTHEIFNTYGINSSSFLIGATVTTFFILDVIVMYIFFSHQLIVINPKERTITISQTNKLSKTSTSIDFDQIRTLNLIEINKKHYDIQITLKNNQVFLLFAFGDYCKKDKQTITKQLEIIQQATTYNNNFFFTDIKKQ